MCLGRLDVRGSLTCGDMLVVGGSVVVGGDLHSKYLRVAGGFDSEDGADEFAQNILAWMPKRSQGVPFDFTPPRLLLADESVASELVLEGRTADALSVAADCFCEGVDAQGGIRVGGVFNADDVDALGFSISAQSIYIEGDVFCGYLEAAREITVDGNLQCVNVDCMRLRVCGDAMAEEAIVVTAPDRHELADIESTLYQVESGNDPMEAVAAEDLVVSLQCGSIKAGSVSAAGSIRADRAIEVQCYLKANCSITSGQSISTGKGYGVLAGIGVPRDRWFSSGYVCAPEKPRCILTGAFRALSRRRRGWALKPKR